MYDLSDVFGVEEAASIGPGSNILVSGPAMTGKEDLALEILADGIGNGEGALAVTTGSGAEETIAEVEARAASFEGDRVAAIDCRAESGREDRRLDNGAYVHHVPSPSALTDIGICITNSFDRLHDIGVDRSRLALMSLSTMITYADRETVFKFCHVLSSRLDSAGFLGVFTIDSNAHDDQTLQVIKQAFDGLIEVREEGGTREARVVGLEPTPSEWVEL